MHTFLRKKDHIHPATSALIILAAAGLFFLSAATAGAQQHIQPDEPAPDCDATVAEGESIQNAIDAASIFDRICLEDGVYQERLFLSDSLTLASADGASPVLDGNSDYDTGLTISGNHVTVSGLEIRNFTDEGIYVSRNEEIVIRDNVVENNGSGIRFNRTDGALITNNVVSENEEAGIYHSDLRATGSNFTATHNTVTDNGQHGIDFRRSSDVRVDSNYVSGNSRGIHLSENSGVQVIGNDVTGREIGTGIWSRELNDVTISQNTVSDQQSGILVSAGSDNILIEENDVTADDYDLTVSASTNATVQNNSFTTGMVLSGRVSDFDPDYFLQDISGNTINGAPLVYIRGDENTDIDPDAAQIIAVNVSDLEISGYTFDQVASGIQLAHGQNVTVTDIHVTDHTTSTRGGITLTETFDSKVDSSSVTGGGEGILVEGGARNVISNNEATGNATMGILIENTGTGHLVQDNVGTQAEEDGIHVRRSMDSVTVAGNHTHNNQRDGIHVRWNTENTTLEDNIIENNTRNGVYDDASNTVLRQNSITGNSTGVTSSGDLVDARENWWGASDGPSGFVSDPETGTSSDGSGDQVHANIRFDPWLETDPHGDDDDDPDDPNGEEDFVISECRELSEPGEYEISGDLEPAEEHDDCITITAGDVEIDGNDATISSSGSGTAVLAADADNLAVKNLTIQEFRYGIQFENVSGVHIENLTAETIGQAGVWLTNSTEGLVTGSSFIDNRDGVVVREGGSGNVIEDNTAENNRRYGFIFRDTEENLFRNNTAENVEDYAFRVISDGHNNVLEENTAIGSGDDSETGFDIRGDGNVLEDNHAEGNDREGFRISGSDNQIIGNTVADNNRDGIRIVDGTGNLVENNEISGSGNHGLRLWAANDNTLKNNVVTGGDDNAFRAHDDAEGNEIYRLHLDNGAILSTHPLNYSLDPVHEAPEPSDELQSLGVHFEAMQTGDEYSLEVSVHFDDLDIDSGDQERLSVRIRDDDQDAWVSAGEADIDTENETVTITTAEEGVFGLFLDETGTQADQDEQPEQFALSQNYPNPFNPETQIAFELPEQAHVTLEVYNSLGEKVTTLVNETREAGRFEVEFDASHLSSGTYIYRIRAGDFTKSRTMMLVK